jgi:hypothetical protein
VKHRGRPSDVFKARRRYDTEKEVISRPRNGADLVRKFVSEYGAGVRCPMFNEMQRVRPLLNTSHGYWTRHGPFSGEVISGEIGEDAV